MNIHNNFVQHSLSVVGFFIRLSFSVVGLFILSNPAFAGNTPCTATPLSNDMTSFQTYSNLGNTNSGVEDPGCGNYVTADIWFSVTAPASGMLDIVTLAGGLSNGAMAFYEGPCNNLDLISCMDDDNCGNSIMPIMQMDNLTPGSTYYIRIWAENGAPNGDFQIRVSNGPGAVPPIPTTALVGTAFMTNVGSLDCVQLTTTTTGQSGCAWDPMQINMNQPFDETFNLNFGTNNAGADGICWVFQNNPSGLNACGTTGMQIAANITNSFIIEMDTYDNGVGFGDIPQDHLSINVNGNMGAPINGPNSLGDIEDGQDHEVRFVWDPSSNSYEVYFDGNLMASGNYDIINNCLGGNPFCYWGFTASTGGAVNNQTVCPVAPPPYPAGDELTIDVEICEGDSYYAGGANQTMSGFYSDIFSAYNGCDSIVNTNLTVVTASTYEYDVALCQGGCETVGGIPYCNSGTYEVLFANGNYLGCDSIVTLNLTILDPISVIWPPEPITCYSSISILDGSLSTSGPGMVNYIWSGPGPNCILSGDGTPVVSVNCPGIYTLTIVQSMGNVVCSASNSIFVEDNAQPPVADAGTNQNIDCENTCVVLDAGASSSGQDISYTWTGPNGYTSTEQYPFVCEPGFYTLTVVNLSTGCLATDFVEVFGNSEPPTADAEALGLLTCTAVSVTLDGSNSSGNGVLQYEWLDENGNGAGTGPTVDVGNAGTYVLIITDDSNGCTDQVEVVVEENMEEPDAQAIVDNDLTCEFGIATLDGSASSGNGALDFEWLDENLNSIGLGSTVDVNAPGIYTLIITDSENGCTSDTAVEVFENMEPPVIDATSSGNLDCSIDMVTLDGSNSSGMGNLDFEWFDEGGSSIGINPTLEVNSAGDYTLIITDDSNGCIAETTLTVEENNDAPQPDAVSSGDLSCSNEMVTLDGGNSSGTGNLSFEWLDENDTSIGMDTTLDISIPGDYTLIVTDSENACTAETSITVLEDITPPVSDAGPGNSLTCDSSSVTLDGTGSSTGNNITYEWINAGAVSVGEEITVEVSETGSYTLIVTDTDNGCTASSIVEVTPDDDLPTADAGSGQSLTCAILSVNLDGSGSSTGNNINYEWLNPTNDSIDNQQSVITDLVGTYTLIVTNTDNGCTATSTVEVSENLEAPSVDSGDDQTLTCDAQTVTLQGSGSGSNNLSFEWQNPSGDSIAAVSNIVVDETGIYTLIITNNDNGCMAQSTVEVLQDVNVPNADAGPDGLLTCDVENWMLDGSNSSGGTLEYEWQDTQGTTISLEVSTQVSTTGTYTLIITDTENACTASNTIEILEDVAPPPALALGDTILNCNIATVTLEADNPNGNPDLSFEWFEGVNSIGVGEALDVSNSGTYTLVVTNTDNGCTATDDIAVILDDATPVPDAGPEGTLTCTISSLTYDAVASTGNGTLSYEWQDAAGDSIGNDVQIDLTAPGTYNLIVTDQSNGCTATTTATVFENINLPTADAGPETSLTCDQTNATLTGSGSTDSGDISYEWQNNNAVVIGTTASIDVSQTGIFTLIVTDNVNGCTALSTVEVTPDDNLPDVDVSTSVGVLTCLELSANLNAEATISGQMIAFEWFDPNNMSISNDQMINVNEAGIYTIIVTDIDNGCSASASLELFENIEVPQADAGQSTTLTCDETTATLDGSGSTGFGTLSYEWTNANDEVIALESEVTIDEAGLYTLLITAENGCQNTDQVEIFLDANVPVADAGPGGVLNCNINSITLGGSGTSSGNNFNYEWLDQNTVIIANTATTDITLPGTYTLSVLNTDNNCVTQATIEIPQNIEIPVADPGNGGTLTCDLTSIELGGSSTSTGTEFTYQWTSSTGVVNDEATYLSDQPDTYILLVTNTENGCTAEAQTIVDQNIETPVADAGPDGILTCDVTQVTLDGSSSSGSNLSFEWFDQAGNSLGDQSQIQVGQTGDFQLLVTNQSNGCTSSAMTNVAPDENLPTIDILADGILNCSNLNVSMDGSGSTSVSGNMSFEWQDEAGNILSGTEVLDVSEPGNYLLIVTDTDNGCSASAVQNVAQDITPPQADAGETQTLTCDQTEVTLTGTGSGSNNLSFEWFENATSFANTASVNVSTTGLYTLIVTNEDNGCSTNSPVFVSADTNLPTADAGTAETLTCAIEEVLLDGSASSTRPDFSYEWQDGSGMFIGNEITLLVNQPGTYTLFVFDDSNGCQAEDQIIVLQDIDPPTALIDETAPLSLNCDINTLVLDGSGSFPVGNLSFLWETINGHILSDEDTPNPEVDESGTYTLTVTNLTNGCTSTESIIVDQDLIPPVALINNPETLTCVDTAITLDGTLSSTGNYSYSWTSVPPGGIVSGETTLEPVVNLTGFYSLTVLNNDNGCESEATIFVSENVAPPIAIASTDDEFDCLTESVLLDGSGSSTGAGISYLWSGLGPIDNAMSLSPTVYEAGAYTLEVTNSQNGCTASSTVSVTENPNIPSALDYEMLAPECYGDLGVITIFSVIGGEAPYLYSLDGGEHFTGQTLFNSLDPGTYTILVQDATGCEFEEIIDIPAVIELNVNVETEVVLNLGDNYQINAQVNIPLSEIDTIIWSPATGLSCTDCLNPRVDSLYQTTDYTVTVINKNGCIATDQLRIRLEKTREIFIPNAFSPHDSDGINDVFMIFAGNNKVRKVNSFRIFDRWGEIIYEAFDFQPNDPDFGWDGRLRGELLNPSVFVYIAEIEFVDEVTELFSGDVTLMR